MTREIRASSAGKMIVVEISSHGAYCSEPFTDPRKAVTIECEAICGNDSDLDELLAEYPEIVSL